MKDLGNILIATLTLTLAVVLLNECLGDRKKKGGMIWPDPSLPRKTHCHKDNVQEVEVVNEEPDYFEGADSMLREYPKPHGLVGNLKG